VSGLFPTQVHEEEALQRGQRLVHVAPERGMDRIETGLTYILPPELGMVARGDRVLVPLGKGNKPTSAWVLSAEPAPTDNLSPPARRTLKRVIARDPSSVRLSDELLALAQRVSEYYVTPLGVTLAGMVPAPVRKGAGRVLRTFVDLPPSAPPAVTRRLTPVQRSILDYLSNAPLRPVESRVVAVDLKLSNVAPIRRLVKAGLLVEHTESAVAALRSGDVATDDVRPEQARHSLTPDQERACSEILPAVTSGGFGVHVLAGPPASGKTEIYLRLAQAALARGLGVLFLVPDLSLTPQTSQRFAAWFGPSVAFVHSGITGAQRHEQWASIAAGKKNVVIGARSALFAPFPDRSLGLIIVDEEHDSSYKNIQAPRYHARDGAVMRARLADCPVLLGSATPSLETYANAFQRVRGRYVWHELPSRLPGLLPPEVVVVDIGEQNRQRRLRDRAQGRAWSWQDDPGLAESSVPMTHASPASQWRADEHLLTPPLESAFARTLAREEQAILLLNRRGYAGFLGCADRSCGWFLECEDCDAAMALHADRRIAAGGMMRCHHCLREQLVPGACPRCGKRLTRLLFGTQRLEEELCAKFPGWLETGSTLVRVDSDSVHGSRAYHDVLSRFHRREIRVLLGTQTLTKGHDFPGVTLVGVIQADTALFIPDFRASERTFQFVMQAVGRAGRSGLPSHVVVQTLQGASPAILAAVRHDYRRFAESEWEDRRRSAFPPAARLARIVVRDRDHRRARARAVEISDVLHTLAESDPDVARAQVRIDGPAPCFVERVSTYHRFSIDLLAARASAIQSLLQSLRSSGLAKSDHATMIDVDPIDLP